MVKLVYYKFFNCFLEYTFYKNKNQYQLESRHEHLFPYGRCPVKKFTTAVVIWQEMTGIKSLAIVTNEYLSGALLCVTFRTKYLQIGPNVLAIPVYVVEQLANDFFLSCQLSKKVYHSNTKPVQDENTWAFAL